MFLVRVGAGEEVGFPRQYGNGGNPIFRCHFCWTDGQKQRQTDGPAAINYISYIFVGLVLLLTAFDLFLTAFCALTSKTTYRPKCKKL